MNSNIDTKPRSALRQISDSWVRFWFSPKDPLALHCLRILSGLLFLAWLLPFASQVDALFGLQGWFDQQAYVEMAKLADGLPPSSSWSLLFVAGKSSTLLHLIYWASIAVLLLFTLGVCVRLTSVLTWLIVGSFIANPVFEYDGDALLAVLAFYMMLGYVLLGQRQSNRSWSWRILGGFLSWPLGGAKLAEAEEREPSVAANLAVRLLQVHFALIVVISGLHKLQFGDWWAGVALWYPLYPAFETSIQTARSWANMPETYLFFLSLTAYLVLAWQLAFPLFAWRRLARPLLLLGGALAWAGCTFVYRLPLFGPFTMIACLSFVSSSEWRRALQWLARQHEQATRSAAIAATKAQASTDTLIETGN